MPDVNTVVPMDQDTKFSLLFKPNVPEPPEQNSGTLPRLQYGTGLGIAREDCSRHKPPEPLYIFVQQEDDRTFHPPSLIAESLAANESVSYAYKSVGRYLQIGRLLKHLAKVAQPVGNRAFHPSSWIVESPTTDTSWKHSYKNTIWAEILERFNVIAQRQDNWDGLESKKPIEESLVRAKRLIEKLLDDLLSAGYSWHMFKPLISCDEDGYITVRWRGKGRRLQLRIEEDEVRYIKSWRENNKRKARACRTCSDNCFDIWEWLMNG